MNGLIFLPPITEIFPRPWSIGLFRGDVEIDGVGYERQPFAFRDSPLWGHVTNSDDISYGEAGCYWGDITHVAVFDALGRRFLRLPLSTPRRINTYDTMMLLQSDMTFPRDVWAFAQHA